MDIRHIFIQVLVLFILILIGYGARKKSYMDGEFTSKLSKLVMTIFLPAMIISSMQIKFDATMVGQMIHLLIISIVMYAISFFIAYLIKFVFTGDKDLSIYQFVVLFSNVGFMGYPVVEAILGKEAIFLTSIFNLPFNLLVMTLGVFLLCRGKAGYSFSIKSIINPVIISIFIGFILFACQISLPTFINQPLEMLGNATTPLSMLVIGSMLCASSAFECFTNKKLYLIAFIRLILLPIVIFWVLRGRVDDPLLFGIPIIICAMPAASNTAILANEYDANISLASQAVFFTTLFSIFTIPFIAGLLLT
ncbi:MAG: AEC family transporter [Turicibacter sp.]